MVGNLSIHSKLIPLLAVPVAGSLLLGLAGAGSGFGARSRAAEETRVAVVTGQALAAAHELQEERVQVVAWVAVAGQAARPKGGHRQERTLLAATPASPRTLGARDPNPPIWGPRIGRVTRRGNGAPGCPHPRGRRGIDAPHSPGRRGFDSPRSPHLHPGGRG